MKTPEEIALIGGGILLSSGLVFGLKSGAASELPNVEHSVSTTLQGNSNTAPNSSNNSSNNSSTNQESTQQQQANHNQWWNSLSSFDKTYETAKQNNQQTGNWGSAKFYVDNQNTLHVGSGQLNGSFANIVNDKGIQSIDLDESIQAPQDSSYLFADPSNNSIPLSHINDMMNLDTHNTKNMDNMFNNDSSLQGLNLGYFDTSNVTDMTNMLNNDNISILKLGQNTKINPNANLQGTYRYGDVLFGPDDGNAHPGTLYKI